MVDSVSGYVVRRRLTPEIVAQRGRAGVERRGLVCGGDAWDAGGGGVSAANVGQIDVLDARWAKGARNSEAVRSGVS